MCDYKKSPPDMQHKRHAGSYTGTYLQLICERFFTHSENSLGMRIPGWYCLQCFCSCFLSCSIFSSKKNRVKLKMEVPSFASKVEVHLVANRLSDVWQIFPSNEVKAIAIEQNCLWTSEPDFGVAHLTIYPAFYFINSAPV